MAARASHLIFLGQERNICLCSWLPEDPWTCHLTCLLPPSLNSNVSSVVARFKNAQCLYNQLQWHDHLQKQLMALWTCSQIMTAGISPSGSHRLGNRLPFCSQLDLVGQGFPLCFFSWMFSSSVQIFADFLPKMFRELHSLKSPGERALHICSWVRRWLIARLSWCTHSHAGRQAAGCPRWSCVTLDRVAGNQLGCC